MNGVSNEAFIDPRNMYESYRKPIIFKPAKLDLNIDTKSFDLPNNDINELTTTIKDQVQNFIGELEQDLYKIYKVSEYLNKREKDVIKKL